MVRNLLRKLIHPLPENLEARIIRAWRLRKLFIIRLWYKLSAPKSFTRYLPADTIYWVNPEKIVFAMNGDGFDRDTKYSGKRKSSEFNVYKCRGRVIGGDWDRLEKRFTELDFYRSYEQRAQKGTSWEQLPYYKRVLAQVENGTGKWGCQSKQDLDERCRMLDGIFNDIKQNGYKSRAALSKEQGRVSLLDKDDEIAVNIGRHGDLIFNNGRHRLTFAKIAGVKKVPVMVTICHSEWEEFVKEVETYVKRNNGKVYAPLTHIGLQTIPIQHVHQRFEMIKRNVGERNSTLLDIGARWGYFCHKFEEEGFHCTAVETEPENLYFLEKLRRAESREFEVIREPIIALSKRVPVKYDIVLALAAFPNFLKDRQSFEELKGLLHSLDVNEMYFEPQYDDAPQMEGAFVNFSPEEFIGFILENSCLKDYQLIGEYEEGRVIYKLWR